MICRLGLQRGRGVTYSFSRLFLFSTVLKILFIELSSQEAAYVDPGFFYETVAPLLIVGTTTLIAISTLTSDINFYTRLMRLRDAVTGLPIFTCMSVELACPPCKKNGKAAECKHLLHLVPRWQSSSRHERLKTIMSDRPDLIESELSGLAFDALHQCFKTEDIDMLFSMKPPEIQWNQSVFIVIDPAAGGPTSDFAFVTIVRQKGIITVCTSAVMRLCTSSCKPVRARMLSSVRC